MRTFKIILFVIISFCAGGLITHQIEFKQLVTNVIHPIKDTTIVKKIAPEVPSPIVGDTILVDCMLEWHKAILIGRWGKMIYVHMIDGAKSGWIDQGAIYPYHPSWDSISKKGATKAQD